VLVVLAPPVPLVKAQSHLSLVVKAVPLVKEQRVVMQTAPTLPLVQAQSRLSLVVKAVPLVKVQPLVAQTAPTVPLVQAQSHLSLVVKAVPLACSQVRGLFAPIVRLTKCRTLTKASASLATQPPRKALQAMPPVPAKLPTVATTTAVGTAHLTALTACVTRDGKVMPAMSQTANPVRAQPVLVVLAPPVPLVQAQSHLSLVVKTVRLACSQPWGLCAPIVWPTKFRTLSKASARLAPRPHPPALRATSLVLARLAFPVKVQPVQMALAQTVPLARPQSHPSPVVKTVPPA
jgi:hypothetical protein